MEYHKPVLLGEVLVYLGLTNAHLNTDTKIIDATLGAGGYTLAMCKQGVKVLGIEADPSMLKLARTRIEGAFLDNSRRKACPTPITSGSCLKLVSGNFVDIESIAHVNGFVDVHGIVFDLGVATEQLISPLRGFSFRNENAILDMRLNPVAQAVKACDLLNALDKSALTKLFSATCTWEETKKLVARIIDRRKDKRFATVHDFVSSARGIFKAKRGVNPVTKAFLALRMAVNSELENLGEALDASVRLLGSGGKLLVISFHSGEDAIVKSKFLKFQKEGIGSVVTKRPIVPGDSEIRDNLRARSAKLRVLTKNDTNKTKENR